MWWRKYDRHEMSVEERCEDSECLAGLVRTEKPARTIKRSSGLEYRYDPAQETKLRAGSECFVAGTDLSCDIVAMDEDAGLVELRVGPGKSLPARLCLIPNEHVPADSLKKAVARYAEAWERGEVASQAVDDLLRRQPPRLAPRATLPGVTLSEAKGAYSDAWPLRFAQGDSQDNAAFLAQVRDLVLDLDATTLCIQGAISIRPFGPPCRRRDNRRSPRPWLPRRRHSAEPQGDLEPHGRCRRGTGQDRGRRPAL